MNGYEAGHPHCDDTRSVKKKENASGSTKKKKERETEKNEPFRLPLESHSSTVSVNNRSTTRLVERNEETDHASASNYNEKYFTYKYIISSEVKRRIMSPANLIANTNCKYESRNSTLHR